MNRNNWKDLRGSFGFKTLQKLVIVFLLTLSGFANAQTLAPRVQNLSQLRVEELSDDQIISFIRQYRSKGYSESEMDKELLNRNLPASELARLKNRIQAITGNKGFDAISTNKSEYAKSEFDLGSESKEANPFDLLVPRIFGAELFNNPKLSFEPNINMATPLNYQLGPGDELLLDIFGFSEQSYQLKVSPEGHIRIPNFGPVQVAGLTVEQAQSKIRGQLVKIYPRIASGETSVSVNLGKIRSIRVTILGEVNLPGTYSLPSLATVFNGLYASGGPNLNGSFRNIKLIRGNKVIAKIDMYDFLINGNSRGNVPLKDQDVIKVEAYEHRVEVRGFVKREGFFEMTGKENLGQLIVFAGGFSPNAYEGRIKVSRNTGSQKSVADVEKAAFVTFIPRNGDRFEIDSVLNRYENRVEISGAVFRPGYFALEGNNKLSLLVSHADGLKEDAFMSRATILRKKEDNSLEIIAVNLADVITGKADIDLKREDKVTVASSLEMSGKKDLLISGSVKNPGIYPYAANMRIEDLIVMAGGLLESASTDNVQVARRSFDIDKNNPNAEISKVSRHTVSRDLKLGSENFVLEPNDVVTIFNLPGYQEQKQIQVNGEVLFPGTYVLSRGNERISDVVKRAGGLTASGFAGGAILIRPRKNTSQDNVVKENKLEALRKLSKDTAKLTEEIEKEMTKTSDIVGIDLEKIMRKPGSKEDIILGENDILEIPAMNQTVLVSGQVLYPVRLRYQSGSSFKSYVSKAGGFSSRALKKRAYIVYANGTAKDTKNFILFKRYPKVKPGAEIVIPSKEDKKNVSAIEVVTIATSLTSLLVIVATLIK